MYFTGPFYLVQIIDCFEEMWPAANDGIECSTSKPSFEPENDHAYILSRTAAIVQGDSTTGIAVGILLTSLVSTKSSQTL